jgi:crotonobetainyl-CoA:carnitine CoA-transferase CaiB-like acyl-CoA transferase
MNDVKILDLSRLLPGPYCSMILADLGCDVTKIEEPHTGDYTRWMPPFIKGESARFLSVNRNKKSMTLNLKTEKGREIFFKLVQQSDVVLESFRPGTVQRLQVDYERARTVNPRIIYCSISAYGQDGPYKNKAAHDINILGLGGVLSITRDRTIPGIQIADTTSGLLACIGILAALITREKTGKGQYVDISMLDGMVSLLSIHAAEYFAAQMPPVLEKMPLSGGVACYNVYETKDSKFVTLGALEPKFWNQFCTTIEREDLVPRHFDDDQLSLKKILQDIFRQKTQKEWLDTLKNVCTPVNSLEDVFCDPQVLHRGMLCEVNHPAAGSISQVGQPIKSDISGGMRMPPPMFGEHTREILAALGFSNREIEQYKEEGVI